MRTQRAFHRPGIRANAKALEEVECQASCGWSGGGGRVLGWDGNERFSIWLRSSIGGNTEEQLWIHMSREEARLIRDQLDMLLKSRVAAEACPTVSQLIERSSLGTPEAKAIRSQTPQSVVDVVLKRADEFDAEKRRG